MCKKRYKNRQGLSYHLQHSHQGDSEPVTEDDSQPSPLEPAADPRKQVLKKDVAHPVAASTSATPAAVTSAGEESRKSQPSGAL